MALKLASRALNLNKILMANLSYGRCLAFKPSHYKMAINIKKCVIEYN
jgi:hypothetical protein